jgi:hypothetical protein
MALYRLGRSNLLHADGSQEHFDLPLNGREWSMGEVWPLGLCELCVFARDYIGLVAPAISGHSRSPGAVRVRFSQRRKVRKARPSEISARAGGIFACLVPARPG